MKWIQSNNVAAPQDMVDLAEAAAKEFGVPAGIILGTIERESNFRLGLVSSADAVGPCQFKRKFAADYHRYAGFEFDLEGLDSIRGMAAIYKKYASWAVSRHGYTGDDRWRYALAAHRWGQNSKQARHLISTGRVSDVEECMRRNGVWYSEEKAPSVSHPPIDHAAVAARAVKWALDKLGYPYSQPQRAKPTHFDCSSLVARAYSAQGMPWDKVGNEIPTSTQEVYSDYFELLWPKDYAQIGRTFGTTGVINKAKQPGDLQFICTNPKTSRANKITHVTMVVDSTQIVHARGTEYGVRKDDIELYKGKICAVVRYNPDAPLRKGMRGLRVEALQKALNLKGANLKVDGVYGEKTRKAAVKYLGG